MGNDLFEGAIHRGVIAQTLRQNQYAESGKRDAQPYVEHDRCVEVPLERYRQRTQAWIDNAPFEDEKFCRIAYQEAFEAEIGKSMDKHNGRLISLPEGVQITRYGRIRYYWYNRISDASRQRLWRLMESPLCPQLVSNSAVQVWLSGK